VSQLEQPQNDGVVVVEAGISEVSVAEQDMYHEAENHDGVTIGVGGLEVAEALLEAGREIEPSKEGLKQDQTGEGGELLILELETGESPGFTFDLRSAKLHGGDLQGLGIVSLARSIITQVGRLWTYLFPANRHGPKPHLR
jgi:hypothetical protein